MGSGCYFDGMYLASSAEFFKQIEQWFIKEAPVRPRFWLFAEFVECPALAELELLGLVEKMASYPNIFAWRLTNAGLAELAARLDEAPLGRDARSRAILGLTAAVAPYSIQNQRLPGSRYSAV